MAYITPVLDRTAADLVARNSKAFFNVVDFTRIKNNLEWTWAEVDAVIGVIITDTAEYNTFVDIPTPTMSTIPSVTNFNLMLYYIELLRQVSLLPHLTTAIKYDWIAGVAYPSPTYVDVNLWEYTIDQIHIAYTGGDALIFRTPVTGKAIAGASLTRNSSWR